MAFFLFIIQLFTSNALANDLEKLTLQQIEKELQSKLSISKDWFVVKDRKQQKKIVQAKEKRFGQSKTKSSTLGDDWMAQKSSHRGDWFDSKKREIDGWQQFRLNTLKRWQNKKKQYRKNVKIYKKNAVKLPVDEKKESPSRTYQYGSNTRKKVIASAFYRKALDQGARPTCVAFASVRAIEILLAQNKKAVNLSEQYFYYISKPECQQSPCNIPGSWATKGLKASIKTGLATEENCPYRRRTIPGNETQIPLPATCHQTEYKLKSFYKVKSINSLVESLDKNHPVVAGMKLTDNFYKNNGVVDWSPYLKKGNDQHADGHAALLIGYYKLPPKLHSAQGRYCFILANSWGEGWGVGGHACLTEKWFAKQRYKVSMLAIDKI